MSSKSRFEFDLAGVVLVVGMTVFMVGAFLMYFFSPHPQPSVVGEAQAQDQVRVWPNSMGYDQLLLNNHTDQGACGTIDLSREVNSAFSLRLQGPYRLGSSLTADQYVLSQKR